MCPQLHSTFLSELAECQDKMSSLNLTGLIRSQAADAGIEQVAPHMGIHCAEGVNQQVFVRSCTIPSSQS